MIRNYFKVAWRTIKTNKFSSVINIGGLAIGLACVMLIGMYIKDELSFDRSFKDTNRIFRVNLDTKMGNDEGVIGHTPPPVGAALQSNFPQVESYTRIMLRGDEIIHYKYKGKPNSITEKKVLVVDSNFLTFFNYPLAEGNAATCLTGTNSIVITQKAAKKYFGDESPIGKTLTFDDYKALFTVRAVLKDIPKQSSLQFDILQPTASVPVVRYFNWSWVWLQMGTYVKLRDNVAIDAAGIAKLESKFPQMVATQAADAFRRIGQPFDEFKRKGNRWDLHLQPLADLHLYSANIGTRYFQQSDIKYVYIFGTIGLFIILLACVNFMNLATARSAKRAKEIGIRKVLGSERKQLISQFMAEALIYTLFATFLAVGVVFLVLPAFNQLADKELSLNSFLDIKTWAFIAFLAIITALLSGSYPALFFTSFKPIAVLKGGNLFKKDDGNFITRNALVVFQFTVSTVLIIGTIVVYKQLIYAQTKDLGFQKENVLILSNTRRLGTREEPLRQNLLRLSDVADASISSGMPAGDSFGDTYIPETSGSAISADASLNLSSFMVDEAFVPTLKLNIIKGRNFSKAFADSASVILNEKAVKLAGWKDPIGKSLTYPGNANQKFKVIGVVKDFNTQSLRNAVDPYALFYTTSKTYNIKSSYISIRIKPGDYNKALANIQREWKAIAPELPIEYNFMDAAFNALYKADQTIGKVFAVFTLLSLTVACLGLLGLAMFTAERRTKEIGIRKVLGASVQNMVTMLSADFLKLILIATVIAFPLGWLAMNKWLQDFAYPTPISWWVFALAGGATLLIAILTVSFQAAKAALMNPVKSLRSE